MSDAWLVNLHFIVFVFHNGQLLNIGYVKEGQHRALLIIKNEGLLSHVNFTLLIKPSHDFYSDAGILFILFYFRYHLHQRYELFRLSWRWIIILLIKIIDGVCRVFIYDFKVFTFLNVLLTAQTSDFIEGLIWELKVDLALLFSDWVLRLFKNSDSFLLQLKVAFQLGLLPYNKSFLDRLQAHFILLNVVGDNDRPAD